MLEIRVRESIVLTDHPWPDLDIERAIIADAGYDLVTGGVEARSSQTVEALVRDNDPVAILTCWAPVSATAIDLPTNLAIVARLGVGLDNIAVDAATARGAWVTNVPDYCVSEVSDHAVALTLAALRNVVALDREIKETGWHAPALRSTRLSTLTVGIVGYGRIGRETARKIGAFGCRVLAVGPRIPNGSPYDDAVQTASIETVQAEADVIILHAPLTAATNNMVDDAFLSRCAARPLIVNVSRGGLIDNDALLRALTAGQLRGAALDVVAGEPTPPRALLNRRDVLVTPHVAYLSVQSLEELRRRACEEVVRVLRGEAPLQPCNEPMRAPAARLLTGGVSSDVTLVESDDGPIVIKRALPKLKVAADWFSDPARASTESRALRAAAALLGSDHVPELLWEKPTEHSFAMRLVDPRLRNWKQDLLAGRLDLVTARQVGRLLGTLHQRSSAVPSLARDFDNRAFFTELRIRPFFERVGERIPTLAREIAAVVAAMEGRREALVHGDYSPKNILVDGNEVVILDFEVAHWGDPRFDVAFCLSHLMLKAFRREADRQALFRMATAFLDGYDETRAGTVDGKDLVRLLGCLLLARTDGDSPPDYLTDIDIDPMRERAASMLLRPAESVRPLFEDRDHSHLAPLREGAVLGSGA